MDHHFDVDLACEVGIEKATILHNIVFWIHHNIANDANENDGHFWTYNTAQAFADIMPYISSFKIARLLRELCTEGYLLTSNKYNDNPYDKTKWYALGDKMDRFKELPCTKQDNRCLSTEQSNVQNTTIERTELNNHIGTDINPDKNQDIKPDKKHFSSSFENSPNNKGAPTKQMTTIERKEYLKDSIRRVKIRETG